MQAPACCGRWVLQASTGTVPVPAFAHPGWLYLWKAATLPSTSLTASGAPHTSLGGEITQLSLRSQVQSKGKKVLRAVWHQRWIHHHWPWRQLAFCRDAEVIKQIGDNEIRWALIKPPSITSFSSRKAPGSGMALALFVAQQLPALEAGPGYAGCCVWAQAPCTCVSGAVRQQSGVG